MTIPITLGFDQTKIVGYLTFKTDLEKDVDLTQMVLSPGYLMGDNIPKTYGIVKMPKEFNP